VEGELARVENVPSHLAYDASRGALYIADTGNGRVVALDTKSGTPAEELATNEPIALAQRVAGAKLTEIVPAGFIGAPSGLAFAGGALFVTDRDSGMIHAFDRSGTLLRSLDSGLGPGTIAGITIGPDDRAYFVDQLAGRVLRVDVP
jgi:DNA-binding beta-propeller fold protein YncE